MRFDRQVWPDARGEISQLGWTEDLSFVENELDVVKKAETLVEEGKKVRLRLMSKKQNILWFKVLE